jgi:protoporphyrinogen oxidase
MTENIYEYCIKPGVEPFWYFSCEDVSRAMTTVLQGRAADAKFYTFKNGMASISKKLLNDITVHYNCEVQKIEFSGEKYQVSSFKDQLLKTSTFDGIVMASPATVAKKIIAKEIIPEYIAEFIKTQKYVANLHATYLVDQEDVKDLLAYYYPCGKWKTPIAAIVLHKIKAPNSIKAPADKELISVYLLDNPTKEFLNEPKEMVLNKVWEMARTFEPLLPEKCEFIELFIRKEAIPLHEVGRYKLADKINKNQKGNLVFAGDYLSCATVEGALRSGRWAANKLMNKNSVTF